ncbi:MAG: YeeE/YedE thiosulfate transporter family protein [Humidesulfovibrio sp.]|uniref:YeeE/YedE thiosulfate transporter family protein n=1 Tax=Humidesulfovibrio sp. TaxID=2910988 RepID=UPI002734CC52|nr:YeeE/YedE thiosulfate transporter family protein [Humidesulfovibrio sp.]MDP2848553.1 YeeE/YedE thiosulfate transporter family protein [Humidesulfovibrio sp.]
MEVKSPSKAWNPYLAGALAGLLLVLSVYATGKYFGASTTYVRAAGFVESAVDAERVSTMAYFIKEAPKIDWQFLFVAGIGLGALGAAVLSNTFRIQLVPDRFAARFGQARGLRIGLAFLGGAAAMFGARLADGCPSGHGLSGSLQLAASGFVSLMGFFAGGLVMARLVYGRRGGK